MGTERSEDAAWRSIVDNYGERARIDDEPRTTSGHDLTEPLVPASADPEPTAAHAWDDEPEERFVPPPPAPAPQLPLPKRLAWIAVLGSPVLLVLALLVSVALPAVVGYALVAAFLGGFGYLVATMQRAQERDPGDDGAQI